VFVVIDHVHKIQTGLNSIRCYMSAVMNAGVNGWNDYRLANEQDGSWIISVNVSIVSTTPGTID
jgi:hypothetical protein